MNSVGPHIYTFLKINKCIILYVFLNDIFSSLAYFIVRIQYIIPITYKICVTHLFMLSVRRLLVFEFWGSQKMNADFQLWEGVSAPLTLVLFKGEEKIDVLI